MSGRIEGARGEAELLVDQRHGALAVPQLDLDVVSLALLADFRAARRRRQCKRERCRSQREKLRSSKRIHSRHRRLHLLPNGRKSTPAQQASVSAKRQVMAREPMVGISLKVVSRVPTTWPIVETP